MQCSMNPTVRPRHQQENCTERIKLCIDLPSSENTNCASPSSVDMRGAEQHSSEVSASDEEGSEQQEGERGRARDALPLPQVFCWGLLSLQMQGLLLMGGNNMWKCRSEGSSSSCPTISTSRRAKISFGLSWHILRPCFYSKLTAYGPWGAPRHDANSSEAHIDMGSDHGPAWWQKVIDGRRRLTLL